MLIQHNPPFYGYYKGQPALASTSSEALGDFVGAKFYCPHALADGNQHIRIREKTLEFSSTMLSTLSLYPFLRRCNKRRPGAYNSLSPKQHCISSDVFGYMCLTHIAQTMLCVSCTKWLHLCTAYK